MSMHTDQNATIDRIIIGKRGGLHITVPMEYLDEIRELLKANGIVPIIEERNRIIDAANNKPLAQILNFRPEVDSHILQQRLDAWRRLKMPAHGAGTPSGEN